MTAFAFLFSFSGPASRFAAVCVALTALIAYVGLRILDEVAPMQVRYAYPLVALFAVVLLAVSARRLYDAGKSRGWALLTLIPAWGLAAGFFIALLPQRRGLIWANNGGRLAGFVLVVMVLTLGVLRVWWVPYAVVGESMKPALLVGDYLVAKAGEPVVRGDIVLMHLGLYGAQDVKRVIGLAGDRVALRGGQVWLNGAPLVQLPQGDFVEVMAAQGPLGTRPRCANGLVGAGAICRKSHLREVLPNGRGYGVLNIETGGVGDEMAEVTVPAGMMFVLGDNRDASMDSRFGAGLGGLGFVPAQSVLGVAKRVVISSDGRFIMTPWTVRLGRFWSALDG
jgi:signal peptidase I